jgi:hypothetical protein
MKAEQLTRATILLPLATAKTIIHQCELEFLLPRQVLARCFGNDIAEPVIFRIPGQDRFLPPTDEELLQPEKRCAEGRGVRHQQRIYLSILAQLLKAKPKKFAEVAPRLHGRDRVYFGRSREEVETTGSSNKAESIPDSAWWASVDNDRERKRTILTKLMRAVGGFSEDYIHIISQAPYRKFPMLSEIRLENTRL